MNGRGVNGLIEGLRARGFDVTRAQGIVSWPVEVATGQLAGATVEVGVAENELTAWPGRAPHWIHARNDVSFTVGSPTQQSPRSGWTAYSRGDNTWGRQTDHVQALLAYLQAVLEAAR
ncbi:hypothetical protein BH23ACT10_BH23ACT10_20730 [soil metagenome]